jgi:hypothetical protein
MNERLWPDRLGLADWLVPLGGIKGALGFAMAAERMRHGAIAQMKSLRAKLRSQRL